MPRKPQTVTVVIEPTHGQGQEALVNVIRQLVDQALASKGESE
jgi:hypothetical protein